MAPSRTPTVSLPVTFMSRLFGAHDQVPTRFEAVALPLLAVVYRAALRFTGHADDARDITLETFLRPSGPSIGVRRVSRTGSIARCAPPGTPNPRLLRSLFLHKLMEEVLAFTCEIEARAIDAARLF